jgi:drug/metabolite transporter (DMT)-like permease
MGAFLVAIFIADSVLFVWLRKRGNRRGALGAAFGAAGAVLVSLPIIWGH